MKIIPFLILGLFIPACNQTDFEVYRVAKTPSQSGAPIHSSQKTRPMDLHWDLPDGWTQVTASGMRVATIKIQADLEMSVIRLRGAAGGLLANINRWRGQLELGPITERQLKKDIVVLKGVLGDIQFIDYKNDNGLRMMTGILPYKGFSWFFKTTGASRSLAAQKKEIQSFLKQIHAAH